MYEAEISRSRPACILFLVDQSGSMDEVFGGRTGKSKAAGVADAINRLFQTLVVKCSKEEGVRDYYYVGTLGYGGVVGPALGGALAGAGLAPISQVAAFPLRVEDRLKKDDDGAGGIVERLVKFPIWFDPQANGGTPMCDALRQATALVSDWISDHPDSFPPIVINITDGVSTDGDPSNDALTLRALSTSDGSALLFNIHISSRPDAAIAFPDSEISLPDDYARLLFQASSLLPDHIRTVAAQAGYPVTLGSRCFVFNGDLPLVIETIDIGTRPANMR